MEIISDQYWLILVFISILIITQWFIRLILKLKKRTSSIKKSTNFAFSIILLPTYIVFVYKAFTSLLAWPHIGSLTGILLFIVCPGICYQFYFLGLAVIKKQLKRWKTVRLCAVLAGIAIAAGLNNWAEEIAMKRFIDKLQPIVKLVAASTSLCGTTEDEIIEQMQKVGPVKGRLIYNADGFVLLYPGGSADIDGSTIYYFSKEMKWHIFHNDNQDEQKKFEQIIQSMRECGASQNRGPVQPDDDSKSV